MKYNVDNFRRKIFPNAQTRLLFCCFPITLDRKHKTITVAETFIILLIHCWKRFVRSAFFKQKLVTRSLSIFFTLYILGNLLVLGYFLDVILQSFFSQNNIAEIVNRYVLHFFVGILVIRFFWEKLPSAQLLHYISLPISKTKLAFSYLIIFMLNVYNYIAIILALPYWAKVLVPKFPVASSLIWLLGLFILSLAFSFLIFLLKMFLFNRPFLFLSLGAVVIGFLSTIGLGERVVLTSFSSWLFDGLLGCSLSKLIILLTLCAGLYLFASYSLREKLIVDNV